MYTVVLLVIWTLSTFATGSDYLIAVHERSSVRIPDDESGGSVQIAYINYNRTQSRKLEEHDDLDIEIEEHIDSTLGYDDSTTLISCSNSAFNLTIYAGTYRNEYNIFSPLPVTALGKNYVVSSCHQKEFEFSVLVITAYKVKADVAINFDTNLVFSYEGHTYRKGDTFRLSIKAYQTFTLRVRYDLSGTRINSTETIAVFSGTASITTVYTYTQLLPVELFSDEFVLAVDDSMPPFQLQIIGERSGFQITFNNGSLASTSSSILSRFLKENETFSFVSNVSVMVTLCRSVGNQKGHVLLPPTSMYINYKEVYVGRTTIILAYNTADIYISHPFVTGGCKNISNTNFTVGIFSITTSHTRIYFARRFFGVFITLGSTSFFTGDLSLAKMDHPITDPSEAFIIVSTDGGSSSYMIAVGKSEAKYQVFFPGYDSVETRSTYPYVADYFGMLYRHHRMYIVETNNKHLHLFLQDKYDNEAMSVPIIPVSSLGKKYVIPFYDVRITNNIEITLATGNWTSSVEVTKRNGSVTRFELVEHQTKSINSDVSGMTVTASRKIAVFAENNYPGNYDRYMYSQLTPSEDFGKEYVLVVGSLATKDFTRIKFLTEEYYINITCLFNNTIINFIDGITVIIGEIKFYQKDVMVNGSLHFTSSKPVMAYLCLKAEFQYEDDVYQENPCTILPPVERYDDSAVISIPARAELKIMTKQENNDFHFQSTNLIPHWEDIPNTDYKVGTANVDTRDLFMKSTHKFSVTVYGYDRYSNPKYNSILSISSLTGRQRTAGSSANSDHTSTSTLGDHQLSSGVDLSSTMENQQGVASSTTPQDKKRDFVDNIDLDGDNNETTLIVGCVSGFIILVFGCIVGFLVFRLRRNNKSKSKTDTRTSQSSATEQETPFDGHTTPVVQNKVFHVTKEDGGHTHSKLTSESQAVNEYESVDWIHGNRDTLHANTYSDLVFEGQADNEYEKIDQKRKNKRSDYENC